MPFLSQLPINRLKKFNADPEDYQDYGPTQQTSPDLALEGLRGRAAETSGMISGRMRQEDLLNEMKRNIYLEGQGKGRVVSGATPLDVESLQSKLNESPNFGTVAQATAAKNAEASRSASLGGFGSPQEAAGYGRQMEAEKIQAPQREAEIQGASALERQREYSRGALEVEKARGASKEAQYEAFQQLLGGSGAKPKSISMSGIGSTTFDRSNPEVDPAMYTRLDAARKAHENSKTFGFGGDAGLKAEVDKLMQLTGLSPAAGGTDAEIEKFAVDIMNDPTAAGLPWEQLQLMLPPELSLQQREALRVALEARRGGM